MGNADPSVNIELGVFHMNGASGMKSAAALSLLDAGPFGAVEIAVGASDAAVGGRSKSKRDTLAALALASCRDMNASLKKASQDWSSPVDALKHVIRAYSNFAKRFPARYRLMRSPGDMGRQGELAPEVRRTVQIVVRLVQAAQQSGELIHGDPETFAALIVGAMHGQADLDRPGAGLSMGELPPLLLLELLGEKSGGRSAPHFERFFGSLRMIG